MYTASQTDPGARRSARSSLAPVRRLRTTYITALGVIAALTVGAQVVLAVLVNDLASDATVITIAGDQQRLSQRLAIQSMQLASVISDPEAEFRATERLKQTLGYWLDSHRSLVARDRSHGQGGENSERVRTAFTQIEADRGAAEAAVLSLLRLAGRTPPSTRAPAEARALAATVAIRVEGLLPGMHEISAAYEMESHARLERLQIFQFAAGLTTLLVLLAEALLIFEPVLERLRRQSQSMIDTAESNRRMALIAQRTTNAVVTTNADRRITWVNEGFTRITGYTLDEVLGRSPGEFLQCERTDPTTVEAMREALHEGRPFRGEILNRGKNGHEYWLDVDIQPKFDERGDLAGFMAIESDITSQVLERERLSSIFSAMAEGILQFGADGSIVGCNTAATQILGLTEDQMRGRTSMDPRWRAVREDGTECPGDEHPASITRMTGKSVRNFVLGIHTPDGVIRWISVNSEPVFDRAGVIAGVVASFADVTVQREQALRLTMMIEGAGVATWDWDCVTDRVDFNIRFSMLLGYDRADIEPHINTWARLVHPADSDRQMELLERHLRGETAVYHSEHRMRRANGTWAWILDAGQVFERDADGKPLRVGGIHIDISESRELASRLAEVSERYEAAVSGTSDGLWDRNLVTGEAWYSNRFWTLLGFPEEGPFPVNSVEAFTERLHPEDVAAVRDGIQQHLEFDAPYDVEFRLRLENGGYRRFRSRGRKQLDASGVPVRLAGSIQDVSERYAAQMQLQSAKSRAESSLREVNALRAALDEHSLLSIADQSGRIIDVNTGFCRISGYDRSELLGKDHRILNSGVHPKSFWIDVWRSISSGHAWRGEVCNRRKDGSLYWVDSTIVPYMRASGTVEKYVSIRFDITAQKAAEAKLHEAQDAAMAASASKSEFLANMSHEIRTPMTAILGYTDLLAAEGDGSGSLAQRLEYIDTIKRNGSHLLAIINDILDLSKIEAGKMTVEQLVANPLQILYDVESLMSVRSAAKGISLQVVAETPIPAAIITDPLRLKQTVVNLVGNAIKFTELGGVVLRASLDETVPDTPKLRVDIEDTGIGMTPDQLDSLFQAFSQADTTTTRQFGGTGLGLRISKSLAELLGGDITVTSRPGEGSIFSLTIATGPLDGVPRIAPEAARGTAIEVAEAAAARQLAHSALDAESGQLAGMRIFFAEDGPDNQRLIGHHLRKAGATVSIFDNGRLLLEAVSSDGTVDGTLQDPPPCDLILTDMQMPEVDGYTLARTLRAKGSELPIVALTAHAMSGDLERCLAAGCDSYTSKPIDRDHLLAVCTETAARRGSIFTDRPTVVVDDAQAPTARDDDESRIVSEWADDPDLGPMVGEFAVSLSEKAEQLEDLVLRDAAAELGVAVHQLKGAAGGYGFPTITDAAAEAEALLKSGVPAPELRKAIGVLARRCRNAATHAGAAKSV